MKKGQDRRSHIKDLKKRVLHQHEEKLRTVHLKEPDTEIYDVSAGESKNAKLQTFNELFFEKQVRTVLTKGVAGVGKTVQTRLFMVDWAKEKSNREIDFIVSLKFSELNSRRDKVESMTDLLHRSLNNDKHKGYKYEESKVAFVLDGLEECALSLDFAKNEELTDIEKPASMDVLLTNLIKGNLLPSACLWIISRPSGVDKIPPEYIHKLTECRETLNRRKKLVSALRKRFLKETTQDEDLNHPNQKNTEHIMRKKKSGEVNDEEKNGCTAAKSVIRVNAVSEIFKGTKEQKIRTVLTTGEAGIGKSFLMQKFIKEWAKKDEKSFLTWFIDATMEKLWGKEEVVLFPLNFSKLNLIKEKKVSLVGLLNHFFIETEDFVISNFEQTKILFVFDGLDAYQPPLDFDNNNTLTDVREPASVDVLLTSLIRGTLLPSARLWITSRRKLPQTCVDRMTEIRCKPDVASQGILKSQLTEEFTLVTEGIDMQKSFAALKEIYTDVYIIEGERGEVNVQNEIRQVQDAKFKPAEQETSIKYHNIFKPASEKSIPIRTVLTIGLAGIGKSFATKKYMLDWAEGTANGDIFYMFPLSFRELNLRKDETPSMEELIHQFFPGMKTSEIDDYDKYRILIILDGLDECRLNLDFSKVDNWTDVRKPTSVNVLLTNLIQGKLLPKAQIWITSRPAASNTIPANKVDRVTEVRGFNDEQKEEYFRKRFSDKDLAEKIISHVKKSRSLYIMCHIPVFCWITAKVLEGFMDTKEEGRMPKTLTDMYICFLELQCRQAIVKYGADEMGDSSETNSCWNTGNKKTIVSLGKLAFEGLEEGQLLFTEDNLKDSGLDLTDTAVFSGLFTQIKREGCGLYPQKLFCFVHLSIQEFLAAFYVFHTFNNTSENRFSKPSSAVGDLRAFDFYKTAVDKALDCKNGKWDLFLRFLLGLSLETNQNLLKELLRKTENNKETNKETIEYIKEKIREENSDADKNCNLFYCLNELNDHSLVEEVKKYLRSETHTFENFSASQWSALTFVLLTSDEKLDVFDLKKYLKSEKVLLGMLPVVKVSKTALLSWCELSEKSCSGLSSKVLSFASCNLTELDLSHNDLLDSGVQALADGLKNIHCKLENLNLSGCQVTEKGCSFLASALKSKPTSSLKQLDLSYNHPGPEGALMLSDIAADPNMSLKKLCLDYGGEHRLKPGLKKYDADLKLNENTAGRRLVLSEGNRKVKTVKKGEKKVTPPEHQDRFKRTQVFCVEGLKGLGYWEVEWKVDVGIAVAYEAVGRGWDSSGGLGCNEMSWSLRCSRKGYTAMHGKTSTTIQVPVCPKIAVFLDWEGGTLTYYNVEKEELRLIHTFHAKFTEPLFPCFWLNKGSVTLCEIDNTPLRWGTSAL
ncbi:protein NLRC3-like [Etheostoma cragini]|uniref:protein NLRC3-like n=1 Tax=Etheostoma cragini TaxID=417921 RepID=UPI00155E942E|nr:protein NLRC3-like [Etheostoma cragini]